MGKSDFWNGAIGIGYICAFLAILLAIGYLLFGPNPGILMPDFLGLYGSTTPKNAAAADPLAAYSGTPFTCADGKTLKAEFLQENVRLSLSDGRRLTLPKAPSASGARFANTDESFVFWNEGNTALIEENGTMTYQHCAVSIQY